MARGYLIDINLDDTTDDIVRKCNQNFRRLSMDQSKRSDGQIRREADRADAALGNAVIQINQMVNQAIQQIENKITEAENRLDKKLAEVDDRLNDRIDKLAPPVGTWLYCDYNPNNIWKGTTWVKYEEGRYVVSAGTTKIAQSKFGNEEVNVPLKNHIHGLSPFVGFGKSNSSLETSFTYIPVSVGSSDKYYALCRTDGYFKWTSPTSTLTPKDQGGNDIEEGTLSMIPKSVALPLWHRTK